MLFLIVPVRENVKLLNGINGDVRQSVGIYEAIDHDSWQSWMMTDEVRHRQGALHRESKKRHLTLAHNFTKYWPIFKILSLLDSAVNL